MKTTLLTLAILIALTDVYAKSVSKNWNDNPIACFSHFCYMGINTQVEVEVEYSTKEGFSYYVPATNDEEYGKWIEGLPNDLKSITSFTSYDDYLTTLPKELEQMTRLKIISIGEYDDVTGKKNSITEMPKYFEKFVDLEELTFMNQYLTEISIDFSKLTQLKILKLSRNELTTFPKGIESCPLEELNVGSNHISKFPSKFNKLSETLRNIDLNSNEFKDVEFWDPSLFKNLTYVDVSACPLSLEAVGLIVKGFRSCKLIGIPSISKPDYSKLDFSSLIYSSQIMTEYELENQDEEGLQAIWAKGLPYSGIYSWDKKFFTVTRGNYCAILNDKGEIVAPWDRRFLGIVTEGLYAFGDSETDLVGFKNLNGEVVIEPIYESCYPFKEGRAYVGLNDETLKNKQWADSCSGFANVNGYINTSGKRINKLPICDGIDGDQFSMNYFSKIGLTEVATMYCEGMDSSIGINVYESIIQYVIDLNGNIIYPNETYINYKFYYEQPHIALQTKDGKWGIIDYPSGKIVFPFVAEEIDGIYDGGGKGNFINASKYVIVGQKNGIDEYGRTTYLYGIMDLNGNWIIKPIYEWISSSSKFESESFISVKLNEEYFNVNINGERIAE
jgi:hypothetical protein